jgi:prepilin-type N-terminal cleavage/methylation domain-containing protein
MNRRLTPDQAREASGFTLIELLVVIAIISILASILFPVFATAREKARQTSCTNNLKQLSEAVLMYTDDYDECVPGCADGPAGANQYGGWVYETSYSNTGNATSTFDVTRGSLYSYVKSKGVYICPDDNQGQINGLSYAINACIDAPQQVKVPANPATEVEAGLNIAKFDDTSNMMLFCEEAAGTNGPTVSSVMLPNSLTGTTDDGYFLYGTTLPGSATLINNMLSNRHGNGIKNFVNGQPVDGGTILSYLDGHVKWTPYSTIVGNLDPTGANGWTYAYYTVLTGDSHTPSCP